MCSFFLPRAWFPPPTVHHVVMLGSSLRCAVVFLLFFFVCLFVLTKNDFVAQPKTIYLLFKLKAGFHSFYFADGKNIIE